MTFRNHGPDIRATNRRDARRVGDAASPCRRGRARLWPVQRRARRTRAAERGRGGAV